MATEAPATRALLAQVDKRFPRRSRASDGWIGDKAHAGRDSDHNPRFDPPGPVSGVVLARDFTHDPGNGMDCDRFTDELQESRDRRILYVIFNRWIMDTRPQFRPWQWVRYYGDNAHTRHAHLSVRGAYWDDDRPWLLPMLGRQAPPPPPPAPTRLPVHAPASRVLRLSDPYMRGTDVRELQRVLNAWYPRLDLTQDGIYGPITEAAVRHLQSNAGIGVDGIAGQHTFRVLNMS